MEKLFKPLIVWLHLHPTSAGLVTFLITFFESLAIIGLAIPGSVTLSAIGGLIGSGVIPALPIFIWAIAGAVLGDGVSFWVGYKYHKVIRNIWPIRRFPALLAKSEAFFKKHGGKSIFLSRFVGVLRPVMPIVAGMMRVKPSKFITIEIISGMLWAPAYMLPGILIGAAAAHFAPDKAIEYLLILLLIIFICWLLVWLFRFSLRFITQTWNRFFDYAWQIQQQRDSLMYQIIYEHDQPHRSRPLSILFLALVFSGLYIILLSITSMQPFWLIDLNMGIANFFQSLFTAHGEKFAIIISIFLGQSIVILLTSALISCYFILRRDWHALWHFVALLFFSCLAVEAFKILAHFPRPDLVLNPPDTYSFPSGHTLLSLTFYGFIAFLIAHNNKPLVKKIAYSVVAVISILVMFSRLYLNVHWLSDVVASLFLGALILNFVVLFYRCRAQHNHYQARGLIALIIVGQLCFGMGYYVKNSASLEQDLQLKETIYFIDSNQWWQAKETLLPLYRHNRFGLPAQVLNVQWHGDLDNIKQSLLQNGWQTPERFGVNALKQQLFGDKVTIISPVPVTYDQHQPVLVLVKPIPNETAYLILRLWDINYVTPLEHIYVGSIGYHLPITRLLWPPHQQCAHTYPDPLDQLRQNTLPWQWENIRYSPDVNLKTNPCIVHTDKIIKLRGEVI